MAIDPAQPIPLYFQLKTLLVEEILGGKYGPGDRLPTEHELCELHGVSRNPVNRALSELADEGVLLRQRRRGTFVNPHWLARQPDGPEMRLVVPEGHWAEHARSAAPEAVRLSAVSVPLPELHATITRAVAEGRGPDLAVLDSVWVSELAAAGFLRPLDEVDPGWLRDVHDQEFLEPFVSANRYEDRTYAVQAEADVAGLWFRRGALGEAGLSVPATWDDLRATVALAGHDRAPVAVPGGLRAGETTTYCLLGLLAGNGASVLAEGEVTVDSDEVVETLELVRDLVAAGVVAREAASYEWDQPIRLLAKGTATIAFGGSYDAPALAAATGLELDRLWEEFGFVPMPGGPGREPATLAGGMVYAIFHQAAHPDLSMQLLRRLTTPEALAAMARATAQIPPRASAVSLVAADVPFLADTAAMLEHALVRPAIPSYPRVSAQLQAMLESVIVGRHGPAEAAARAAELVSAITGWPVRSRPR